MISVPTLDQIASDHARARGLSSDAIAALIAKCSAVQAALASALLTANPAKSQQPDINPNDRMLTADEAAAILRRSRRWIYRNADTLPFARRISRKGILCSESGVHKWLAAQRV